MSFEAAKRLLSRAAHYREQGAIELSKSAALSAQAEATLALVEQQRLANLVEYVRSASESPSAQAEEPETIDYLLGITEQIREGLGIEP